MSTQENKHIERVNQDVTRFIKLASRIQNDLRMSCGKDSEPWKRFQGANAQISRVMFEMYELEVQEMKYTKSVNELENS